MKDELKLGDVVRREQPGETAAEELAVQRDPKVVAEVRLQTVKKKKKNLSSDATRTRSAILSSKF